MTRLNHIQLNIIQKEVYAQDEGKLQPHEEYGLIDQLVPMSVVLEEAEKNERLSQIASTGFCSN